MRDLPIASPHDTATCNLKYRLLRAARSLSTPDGITTCLMAPHTYDVRIVMDTDMVVAAMRSPRGASAALIMAIRHGRAKPLLTTALMLEYEAVCTLPEHRLASGLDRKAIGQFLDAIAFFGKPVEVHYQWRPMLRDPGDEMVLETAVNGRAQAIVTFNRRDYADVTRSFGIEILLPVEALGRIEG